MPSPLTPQQRIQRTIEIGMTYLQTGTTANKQYAIECMLALMTGCDDVPEFRRRYRREENKWTEGTPL